MDESGDHKYFTMVPNYVVNHSTAYEQAIYLYLKRKAGESGTCWTSAREIGKVLGMARRTVVIYRNKLLERGWIEIVGRKGKTRPTDEYKITDLWKFNTDFYSQKDSAPDELSPKVRKKIVPQRSEIVPQVNLDSAPNAQYVEEPIKKINKEEDSLNKLKLLNELKLSLKEKGIVKSFPKGG